MTCWLAPWYDEIMRDAEARTLGAWRADLLAELSGEVLDLGAGTGANLPYWPGSVDHVVAAEPDPQMARRLLGKLRAGGRASGVPVTVVHAHAERLPFADRAFDVVVSTLVLCSVDDLERSLAEIRRVLRPGGSLVFLEHVASERPLRRLAQRALEPAWRRLTGGCHLTRRADLAIARAGFSIDADARAPNRALTRESMRGALAIARETVRGVARAT